MFKATVLKLISYDFIIIGFSYKTNAGAAFQSIDQNSVTEHREHPAQPITVKQETAVALTGTNWLLGSFVFPIQRWSFT